MRICEHCETDNLPQAKFCMECGQKMATSASSAASANSSHSSKSEKDYTPAHLQKEVLDNAPGLAGENKFVTVMFVDVRRSLQLSQQVGAEGWHGVLDRFFQILTHLIHRYGGTINQYTGDGVMALFGAPVAYEDHARRACFCGLALQQDLSVFARQVSEQYSVKFAARVGLHSGPVVVGQIGDQLRRDYTAQGETVGIAARIESLCRPGRVYVSDATVGLVASGFEVTARGEVRLERSDIRVVVHELRGSTGSQRRFDRKRSRPLLPLIGRDAELDRLQALLTAAQAGKGQVLLLRGASGLGKSRLLYELQQRVKAQAIPVLQVRGTADYQASPLSPLRDLFCQVFGIVESDTNSRRRRKVGWTFRALFAGEQVVAAQYERYLDFFAQLCVAAPTHTDQKRVEAPQPAVELIGDELRDVVGRILHSRILRSPAVLVLENMHWLRNSGLSSELLNDVIKAAGQSHLLLIMSLREDQDWRWPEYEHVQQMVLQPLDKSGLAELLAQLLELPEPQDGLATAFYEHTGGNPLFVEELLRDLQANDGLILQDQQASLRQSLNMRDTPPSLQAAIAARVDRLNRHPRIALQAASVIGNRFAVGILTTLIEQPLPQLLDSLQVLEEQGFIYSTQTFPEAEYAFVQGVSRDVVYRSLLSEQRQEWHTRCAQLLERDYSGRVDGLLAAQIAQHWSGAAATIEAAKWELRGARWYTDRDLPEALSRWHRVLESLRAHEATGNKKVEATILQLRALSRLVFFSGRHESNQAQTKNWIREGKRLVEQLDEPLARGYFASACAGAYIFSGRVEAGIAALEEGSAAAEASGNDALLVTMKVAMAYAELTRGELQRANQALQAGLLITGDNAGLGSDISGSSALASLLVLQAWIAGLRGEVELTDSAIARASAIAEEREETEHLIWLHVVRANLAAERWQHELAMAEGQAALRLSEQCSNTFARISAQIMLARVHLADQQWQPAQLSLKVAEQLMRDHGVGETERPRLQCYLARCALAAGDMKEAQRLAEEAISSGERLGAKIIVAECKLVFVAASLANRPSKRQLRQAAELMESTQRLIDQTTAHLLQPSWHQLWAELAAQSGEPDIRRQALLAARECWQELQAPLRVQQLQVQIDRLL